jgi:hypothetical protein
MKLYHSLFGRKVHLSFVATTTKVMDKTKFNLERLRHEILLISNIKLTVEEL